MHKTYTFSYILYLIQYSGGIIGNTNSMLGKWVQSRVGSIPWESLSGTMQF